MTGRGLIADVCIRLGDLDLTARVEAAPGEMVVLVGPNGAGKSTLLRAIAGLIPIDSGCIKLDGEVLDDPERAKFAESRQRSIGVVFQDRLLFEHLSALENVAFGLRSRGARRADARRTASEWLARFGLASFASARPTELSGGQAQRVALARALAFEPRLLLLDEPLAALDATTHAEVRRDLRRHLATLDIPKIMVTHDPVEAISLGDRIVVLEAGRVTQSGSPDDVRVRPRSRYVADLVGINLLRGVLAGGAIELAGGHTVAVAADSSQGGAVAATLHPRAITIHRERPMGSARNTWQTTIDDVDDEGERVRVRVGVPVPLAVEVTPSACAELGLRAGLVCWISFKATEVSLLPD